MVSAMANRQKATESLQDELDAVHHQMETAVDELYLPLRELVRAELRNTAPPVRAAIVLAAGVGNPDSDLLREGRIVLAASLEMLAVALHIHRRLLTPTATTGASSNPVTDDSTADRAWLGSMILAGDYCFSRSAVLAARTDHPEVVKIFANALKAVSEGHLRDHFTEQTLAGQTTAFDENQLLFAAGARAAATLAALPTQVIEALADYSGKLSQVVPPHSMAEPPCPVYQSERWQALLTWLKQTAASV